MQFDDTIQDKNVNFQTKHQFLEDNPAFTKGGLDWMIFHKKQELVKEKAIVYFGSRPWIIPWNLKKFILKGGTQTIGGCKK